MRLTRDGTLTALLVVAALFVGSYLKTHLPSPESFRDAPYLHAAAVGQRVTLRTADVTVTGVQAAKRVERFGSVGQILGVWLVVDIIWASRGEPALLSGATPRVITVDGRAFGGSQAVTATCGPAQPGLPLACQLPFEVAADALEGARLQIPAQNAGAEADDVADIDLGITAERAARFAATDAQVKLAEAKAAPR